MEAQWKAGRPNKANQLPKTPRPLWFILGNIQPIWGCLKIVARQLKSLVSLLCFWLPLTHQPKSPKSILRNTNIRCVCFGGQVTGWFEGETKKPTPPFCGSPISRYGEATLIFPASAPPKCWTEALASVRTFRCTNKTAFGVLSLEPCKICTPQKKGDPQEVAQNQFPTGRLLVLQHQFL